MRLPPAITHLASRMPRAPIGTALDLAVFRIAVAAMIASSSSVSVATTWAALPIEARTAPLGIGWLLPFLPITPTTVAFVHAVLLVALVAGAAGLFTRASWCVVALGAFFVLLVPQLGGAVFHDHHLLWFATLLAASPAGDALAIDAWLARRRGHPRPATGRAHGLTIRIAWSLIAVIFFFPGVHKWSESGLAWITSDNLRTQMWWKWAQDPALVPAMRIDRYPLVLHAAAAMTVLFELAFPVLVFAGSRTRLALVGFALLFHQATAYFMGIHFGVLYGCYVVFVPWSALARRVGLGPANDVRPSALAAPIEDARATQRVGRVGRVGAVGVVGGVGAVLVLGAVTAGAAGAMQAFPFACYPTFQWIPPSTMPGLAIELTHDDGTVETLERQAWREPGPRGWALEWRLAGVYDSVDPRRLEAFWRATASHPPLRTRVADARRVQFYRTAIAVDPAAHGAETSRTPIHAIETPRGHEPRVLSSP